MTIRLITVAGFPNLAGVQPEYPVKVEVLSAEPISVGPNQLLFTNDEDFNTYYQEQTQLALTNEATNKLNKIKQTRVEAIRIELNAFVERSYDKISKEILTTLSQEALILQKTNRLAAIKQIYDWIFLCLSQFYFLEQEILACTTEEQVEAVVPNYAGLTALKPNHNVTSVFLIGD